MRKLLASLASLTLCGSAMATQTVAAPVSVHSVAPYFHIHKQEEDAIISKGIVFGSSYKYTKPSGYNVRIDLSLVNCEKGKEHGEISFHNSYKFNLQPTLAVYPYLKLDGSHRTTSANVYAREATIKKSRTTMGIGFEQTATDRISIGLEGGLFKDSMNRVEYSQSKNQYLAFDAAKKSGYEMSATVKVKVLSSGSVEISPFYSESFDDDYSERRLKIAYVYNF